MSTISYLSLGSNIGDREAHLVQAIESLKELGDVAFVSSFYETDPVDFTDQELFLNCAVALKTELSPSDLMAGVLHIERRLGRERIQKKGPRTIDIDILLYGAKVVDFPALTVPHPAMAQRRFVLEPLAEIAPDAQHPVLRKTVAQLLKELPAGQNVWKFCKTQPRSRRRDS
jgi:2-amino-4-hydroxy-6-hydroxymethyldihydropteridine diphosphokinase